MNTKSILFILVITLSTTTLNYSMDISFLRRGSNPFRIPGVDDRNNEFKSDLLNAIKDGTKLDFSNLLYRSEFETTLYFTFDEEDNTALHYALNYKNFFIAEQIIKLRPELITQKNGAHKLPNFAATDEGRALLMKALKNEKYSFMKEKIKSSYPQIFEN